MEVLIFLISKVLIFLISIFQNFGFVIFDSPEPAEQVLKNVVSVLSSLVFLLRFARYKKHQQMCQTILCVEIYNSQILTLFSTVAFFPRDLIIHKVVCCLLFN